MKIIGYLKKQPHWKAILMDNSFIFTGNENEIAYNRNNFELIDVPVIYINELKYSGYQSSFHSSLFTCKDDDDEYVFSPTDFDDLIPHLSFGVSQWHRFTVSKRGSRFSLKRFGNSNLEMIPIYS